MEGGALAQRPVMSSITHLFPPVAVKHEGKATKRKKVRIPSINSDHRGRQTFPDSGVCGILWLCDAGWNDKDLADLLCMGKDQAYRYRVGSNRPHATPKMPDTAFWEWVEKRRDSQKLSANDQL